MLHDYSAQQSKTNWIPLKQVQTCLVFFDMNFIMFWQVWTGSLKSYISHIFFYNFTMLWHKKLLLFYSQTFFSVIWISFLAHFSCLSIHSCHKIHFWDMKFFSSFSKNSFMRYEFLFLNYLDPFWHLYSWKTSLDMLSIIWYELTGLDFTIFSNTKTILDIFKQV